MEGHNFPKCFGCYNHHGVGLSYLIENSHTIYGLRNSDSGPFRAYLVVSTSNFCLKWTLNFTFHCGPVWEPVWFHHSPETVTFCYPHPRPLPYLLSLCIHSNTQRNREKGEGLVSFIISVVMRLTIGERSPYSNIYVLSFKVIFPGSPCWGGGEPGTFYNVWHQG